MRLTPLLSQSHSNPSSAVATPSCSSQKSSSDHSHPHTPSYPVTPAMLSTPHTASFSFASFPPDEASTMFDAASFHCDDDRHSSCSKSSSFMIDEESCEGSDDEAKKNTKQSSVEFSQKKATDSAASPPKNSTPPPTASSHHHQQQHPRANATPNKKQKKPKQPKVLQGFEERLIVLKAIVARYNALLVSSAPILDPARNTPLGEKSGESPSQMPLVYITVAEARTAGLIGPSDTVPHLGDETPLYIVKLKILQRLIEEQKKICSEQARHYQQCGRYFVVETAPLFGGYADFKKQFRNNKQQREEERRRDQRQQKESNTSGSKQAFNQKRDAAFFTLGLVPTMDAAVVKKAYCKKALQYHPDKQPADMREYADERMKEVNNAYTFIKTILPQQ